MSVSEWMNEWMTFKRVVIGCIFLWGMQYFVGCFSQNNAWHVKMCSHNTCSLMSNKLFIIQLFLSYIWTKRKNKKKQERTTRKNNNNNNKKHIWTKRKLTRCAVWHVVPDECGGVFWLVVKTCQSGSFNWTNIIIIQKLFCHAVCHSFTKPVKNTVLYCTIMLYICTWCLDVAMCCIWTFLTELDNNRLY